MYIQSYLQLEIQNNSHSIQAYNIHNIAQLTQVCQYKLHNELSVNDETNYSGVIITSLMFQRHQIIYPQLINVIGDRQLTISDLQ